jgi:PEP-CTERM motif
MRDLPRILALTLAVGLLGSQTASADMSFSFFFDDNGFTNPLNPSPPIVGTGDLTIAGTLSDGTYTLASLPSFTMSFSFADGDTYTQADILSDPTQSEVVIYNNGQNAYFTDITPDDFTGGSITFLNSSGDLLSFSPDYFLGFYIEEDPNAFLEGNYGNAVVPEPSSLTLAGIAGLAVGVPLVIRKRRKAKTSAAV